MLDIAVATIIVLMAYFGAKKGLIRSIFNLGYFVIAAIISAITYPLVTTFLIDTALAGLIRDKVWEVMSNSNPEILSNLPEFLSSGIGGATESVATSLTQLMINLVSIIVVFVIVRLGLNIAGKFLDAVASLPILKSVNRAGGFIIGIFNGFFVVYFLLAVAAFFVSSGITDLIAASPFTNMMYHDNLLLKLIF